jgi:hypothetical protein
VNISGSVTHGVIKMEVYLCQIGHNPSDGTEKTVDITVWDSDEVAIDHVAEYCREHWHDMITDPMPETDPHLIEQFYKINIDRFYRVDAVSVGTE